MDFLDTSKHTKEESVEILSGELDNNPVLILTGPQGGGKTTLAIQMLSEKVGAIFEGRARSAQPVILVRRDAVLKMKNALYERRKLPIFDGDEPIYADVNVYDQLKAAIEGVFDIMELGEQELVSQISKLAGSIGLKVKSIELITDSEELLKRRLTRHMDAKNRLEELLKKEKQFGIDSNISGIQGARIGNFMTRDGVIDYTEDQMSRSVADFDRIIETKTMTVKQCLKKMIEISSTEDKESGFLVLHSEEGEKIISDLVVGKKTHSLIGVTLLEVYIGFRQSRSLYRAYKHELEGKVEVIHSYSPTMMELEYLANPYTPAADSSIISSADIGAAERFNMIVSAIDREGNVESSDKKRKVELEKLVLDLT